MAYLQVFGILQHALLWVVVFLCFGIFVIKKKRKLNLPPGPRGLPIVGILPFLGKNPPAEFCKFGKKYGGVFSVNLGQAYVVVVTDVAIAKQILNKTETADRPPHLFQLLPEGAGLTELNGSEWLEQRRYTIMEMRNLGLGKSNWENLVQMEVSDLIEAMAEYQGKPMKFDHLLEASISNNIMSLVTNERLPIGHPDRNVINNGVESFQTAYSQDGIIVHYPKLFKLAVDFGIINFSHGLKNIMDMHKYVKREIGACKDKEEQTFIKKYLKEIEKNENLKLGNSFNERNLIGNVQSLIIAGSDTTFISILWLLYIMAAFPKVQEKVHAELDSVLGKDGSADFTDRLKLPYCMATIMEGQRWRTTAPLNLLHCTNEDVIINGYDVPKGTNLMMAIYAYHNDPDYWEAPDLYKPERFLSADGKSTKEQFAYFAFSYGKRMCPGKTVAYIELFHYFVCIMQKFRVLPESDSKLPDLEGHPGLTYQPKRQPLRFVPR